MRRVLGKTWLWCVMFPLALFKHLPRHLCWAFEEARRDCIAAWNGIAK